MHYSSQQLLKEAHLFLLLELCRKKGHIAMYISECGKLTLKPTKILRKDIAHVGISGSPSNKQV